MREEVEKREKEARKLREQLASEGQRFKAELEALKVTK